MELMKAVDDYIPNPTRALDKPFSLPIEDVFSIQVGSTASFPASFISSAAAAAVPAADAEEHHNRKHHSRYPCAQTQQS